MPSHHCSVPGVLFTKIRKVFILEALKAVVKDE
jgi:hypothetical protein